MFPTEKNKAAYPLSLQHEILVMTYQLKLLAITEEMSQMYPKRQSRALLLPAQQVLIPNQRAQKPLMVHEREKELVQNGRGTRDWSVAQQAELDEYGRVTGFEGSHTMPAIRLVMARAC